MSNGNITTREFLHRIDQKLDDLIKRTYEEKADHEKIHKAEKADHKGEHKIMWTLIIGLPSSIIVLAGVIKLLGG